MRKKTLLSWSSGKDSAWALHVLRQREDVDVVGLFTTVNREFQRVAMHGVRVELLGQQAEAVGLALEILEIPYPCSNEQYESVMAGFVVRAKARGVQCMAFGDLFLADIRSYREAKLAGTGIEAVFPLWHLPTGELARQMIAAGARAILSCVDPKKMPAHAAGREFDAVLLAELPPTVDPCGEHGEFHSFAVDGPAFARPVRVCVGEIVERDGFVFADILPAGR